MQYGRLDVFWPEGQFQTFPLSDANVSVGRSTGNTIALETTNISRYHFTINRDNGQVFITDLDSANGTYIDGVRLPTNEAQQLYGGEEILIGELRMIYTDMDDSPTRPMAIPEDSTQRIELEAPDFRLDLKGPPQAVSPGAHISAELTITNTGDEPERYAIETSGIPREWVRIDRPQLEIMPQKSELVVISFKPLRRPDSAPGEYHVIVSVRPKTENMAPLSADMILSVLAYGGFGMALEKRQLAGDERFRLHLHNQGSQPLGLGISARGLQSEMSVQLSTTKVTLGPGQRLVVQGSVRPSSVPLFGDPEQYPFDVLARSLDAASFVGAQRAYVTVKPRMPRWAPLAIAGIVGTMAVVVLLLILLLSAQPFGPTEPPEISRFAVSSASVTKGEPVIVRWAADTASELTITVNGTPVFNDTEAIDTDSYTIDTNGLSGDVTVGIEARNAAGTSTDSAMVSILNPLQIVEFSVNPPTLVRYVVQPLTITWNAPGATTTRLTGLEGFTTARIEPTYGAQETLEGIAGIPEQALTLTLYAEDGQGNAAEQSVTVNVIDPMCQPADGDLEVYDEPHSDAQVVATVPEGTSLVVDAQDESRQWLRIILPGNAPGWGPLTSFSCAENFEVGNLRQLIVVPTLVPELEITETEEVVPTSTPQPVVTATPRPRPSPTPRFNPPTVQPTASSQP